jgi:hypothetical protein
VHIDAAGQRIDLVIDRGQLLVFGADELHRLVRHVRIGGDDRGDRLADKAHLLVRQDRLVVEGRAVIGVGQDFQHIVDGDDVQHARDLPGRAGVDRLDAAVRHRAAEDLGMQHPGQPHGVDVFGAAGDLVAAFEPRHRASDLSAGLGTALTQHHCHRAPRLRSRREPRTPR